MSIRAAAVEIAAVAGALTACSSSGGTAVAPADDAFRFNAYSTNYVPVDCRDYPGDSASHTFSSQEPAEDPSHALTLGATKNVGSFNYGTDRLHFLAGVSFLSLGGRKFKIAASDEKVRDIDLDKSGFRDTLSYRDGKQRYGITVTLRKAGSISVASIGCGN